MDLADTGTTSNTRTYTDRAWWTLADAAALLRVNRKTLLRALQTGQIAGTKHTYGWRIPAEALGLTVTTPPVRVSQGWVDHYGRDVDPYQLELDLDPTCLVPVKVYRNTREPVKRTYGTELGRRTKGK